MPANSKLEIQSIIEKILLKHGIDLTVRSYYLRLSMRSYMDLIIEKEGNQVLVGHYYEQAGDLISDPVLAFDYNNGFWHPVRIEQAVGDTVCSLMEDGRRMIYPDRIKEFMAFQRMFARNIKEQGWLEDGERIEND
ncbi:MAG: hypothetical protein Q8O41_08365 [Candidatus Methanoperedens sp.]|nr:hypothetical protein [Candidatus Methanoperedens sp.]